MPPGRPRRVPTATGGEPTVATVAGRPRRLPTGPGGTAAVPTVAVPRPAPPPSHRREQRTEVAKRRWTRTVLALLEGTVTLVVSLILVAFVITVATDHRSLVVLSGSMAPEYPRGALVIARPLPPAEVREGDAILVPAAQEGSPSLLHRVVSVEQHQDDLVFRTKGDANPQLDPKPFVLHDHTYTPRLTLPFVGYVVGTARTPIGWLALVVGPGAVITGRAIRRVWRQAESHHSK